MMNGRNPLLPLKYCIPDGEAHVMSDGKVYLYGSYDELTDGYCSPRYYAACCADLKTWTVSETPSFTAADVPWAKAGQSRKHSSLSDVKSFDDLPAHIRTLLPDDARNYPIEQIVAAIEQHAEQGLPKEIRLYAPDAIEKDGKFYLYFCLSDDTEGAAVSDSPSGPFGEAVQLPANGIDPAVFVDEDGSAYYYWGQFNAYGAKLTPDMMHIEEGSIVENILTEQEHHFHEGSSMRKRGDTYYYVFADTSRGKPSCLGYAISESPLGPFVYQGVIIDNSECDPGCWNIHGSIEEVNGQWYVFYHRSSNNSQYLRRACAEPIFFDENGRIQEVKMTSQGAGKPFEPGESIPSYTACAFRNGAYLDTLSNEKPCIRMNQDSAAVFRYFRNDSPVSEIIIGGSENSRFAVYADDVLIAEGCSGFVLPVSLKPGIHEIIVCSENDDAVLSSLLIR